MNEHIRFTAPADILAYIPHSLGHHPSESFVLLTMNGKRLGATLRIDAPAEAELSMRRSVGSTSLPLT